MLKHLKKIFNTTASADTQKEVISMTQKEDQATVLATDDTTADLTTQLSAVTEAMTLLTANFAELSTKYEAAQAALNASEAAQAMLATQAAKVRLDTRTAAITASVGTDKVASLLAATDALDDTQFNAIVGAMANSFEAEAKSPMFQESGIAASADASKVEEESSIKKALKTKYQTK